jgi:glycosyltransferase involved in cell wall biosynthesis
MKVCCIIPAYQESNHIEQVVRTTKQYIDCVYVIDDGSTDETGDLASKSGGIVVRHPRNVGKGAALRTGFQKALRTGCDIVITLDGDGQHDPNLIPRFLRKMQQVKADVVVGSRYTTLADTMPFLRKLSNLMTSKLLRIFFRIPITDSQSGYRAFSRRILEWITVRDNGFAAETEILIDAKRVGGTFAEVPISTIYGEEESKIRASRDIARWLVTLFRNFIYRERFTRQNE